MSAPANTRQGDTAWTVHAKRVLIAWVVLSVIATPLVWFVLGPHLPPGKGSVAGCRPGVRQHRAHGDLTPIICLLLVFFVYALSQFRAGAPE